MKSAVTAAILSKALGIPGEYGSMWTGRRLLQETWKHKPSVVRDTTTDLRDLPFNQSARSLLFRRPLDARMIGKWVHHYDKNSDFLSACRGVQTGIGDPVHLFSGEGEEGARNYRFTDIVPGVPGIYRVSASNITVQFGGYALPEIIDVDQEWVNNDVLVFAQSKGYEVRIHEAYVFNDYTKVLDKWALKLWDTRQAFLAQYGKDHPAYQEMKPIAHITVGAFNRNKEKQPTLEMIHPNWWVDVVSKARVNMLCNLEKFAAVGRVPYLIYSDGLWFCSRDDNYRSAVPGILDRSDKLGGYKPVYSFKVTAELIDQAQGLKPGQLVELFHKYGKHQTGEYDG